MQSTIQRCESYLCIDWLEETALRNNQFGLQPQEFVYNTLGDACLHLDRS